EHIDEATAGTGNVIFSFVVLLRIGHVDLTVKGPDAERCVSSGKIWVHETVGIHLMKILIVGLDFPGMKVCYEEKMVTAGEAERCTFVNGAVDGAVCAVIDSDDGVRRIQRRVPPRNGAVFTD